MDTPITRAEHEEFRRTVETEHKRLSEEDKRQNQRIDVLEEKIEQISDLTASVSKMATNMENMYEEQKRQGKRLEALESRDGERWRQIAGYILTAIIGIVLGFVFKQFGM